MARVFLVLVVFGIVIYALIDCIQTPDERVRHLPKPLWLVVVVLLPPAGAIAWLLVGRHRELPRQRPPSGPRGPDDDPDFLRGL